MEEPVLTTGKSRKRLWIYITGSLFISFTLYYSVMAIVSSSGKIREINTAFAYKAAENQNFDDRIFSDSLFVKLSREKAYLQSRNLLAESDSIYLSLNLVDSTAFLEINGVTVHTAKLENIKVCKALYRANEYALSSLLSLPFTVMENRGTIMKEPLMLKVAPKDTSEYKPDILPDTANTAPVNYILEMDNGFRIYVYQDNESGEAMSRIMFDLNDRFRNIWSNIKSIAVFRVPVYHPSIKLRMKKVDARIIYRALPVHGQVAIFR